MERHLARAGDLAVMDPQPLLAIAGAVGAAGVLWRPFRGIRRGWRKVAAFLEDWNGEPARPGREAVPAMPSRLAALERELGQLAELTRTLSALREAVSDNAHRLEAVDTRVVQMDARVSDHRRRNEEQVTLLRLELERRINELGDLLLLADREDARP